MQTMTGTYSPEDNKLRLYASTRLDAETYARVRAAGFTWAPKQDLFVVPMWTPERADLLEELCGEIGDEDTSLVDRAEERAERFEDYSDKRQADADAAHDYASSIADGISLGQPILVGHHSERHARRDAQRIENATRKAVRMWETSRYWTRRAAGAVRAAKYKERPDVRARRIKGLEADKRRLEKQTREAELALRLWRGIETGEGFKRKEQSPQATYERARFVAGSVPGSCAHGTWSDLADEKISPQQAAAAATALLETANASRARWLAHVENRLAYERAMLEASGYVAPAKPKGKSALPLLNYSGTVAYRNPYHRGEIIRGEAHGMTRAEWAKVHADYKGTRVSEDGTHRVRTGYVPVPGAPHGRELVAVYLTDQKQHARPTSPEPAPVVEPTPLEEIEPTEEAPCLHCGAPVLHVDGCPTPDGHDAGCSIGATPEPEPSAELEEPAAPARDFAALRDQLRTGGAVKVVSVPQLFPTPPEIARQVIAAADVRPGDRVLEPSAGTGRLLDALGEVPGEIIAVEIHPQLVCDLGGRYDPRRITVVRKDFLECDADLIGTFDRIVMNPPFSGAADIRHVMHARTFLKPGGKLVAIVAGGPRQADALRELATTWRELPSGTFAGTGVRSVLLTIDAPAACARCGDERDPMECATAVA